MKRLGLTLLLILLSFHLGFAGRFLEEKDLREIFLHEFKKGFSKVKGEVSLEKFRFEPDNLKIPAGTPFKIDWIGTPRAGSNSAIISFNPQRGESQIIRVWGYVEVKMPLPVLKRNLASKSIITEEDLTFELKELSRLPHDVLLDKEIILGKETRTSLLAGTVLRASHLSEPQVIKRNQEVEILARGKTMVVKAKGIALENGKLNSLIRVKNVSSQKIVQAKVVGEGLVEVSF